MRRPATPPAHPRPLDAALTDHFEGIALRISHVNTFLSAESRSSITMMPGLWSSAVLLNQSLTF